MLLLWAGLVAAVAAMGAAADAGGKDTVDPLGCTAAAALLLAAAAAAGGEGITLDFGVANTGC